MKRRSFIQRSAAAVAGLVALPFIKEKAVAETVVETTVKSDPIVLLSNVEFSVSKDTFSQMRSTSFGDTAEMMEELLTERLLLDCVVADRQPLYFGVNPPTVVSRGTIESYRRKDLPKGSDWISRSVLTRVGFPTELEYGDVVLEALGNHKVVASDKKYIVVTDKPATVKVGFISGPNSIMNDFVNKAKAGFNGIRLKSAGFIKEKPYQPS